MSIVDRVNELKSKALASYRELVTRTVTGQDTADEDAVLRILYATGKSFDDLTADVSIASERLDAVNELKHCEEADTVLSELDATLAKINEQVETLQAKFNEELRPLVEQRNELKVRISEAGAMKSERSSSLNKLGATASGWCIVQLRDAGARKAEAGNRLNEARRRLEANSLLSLERQTKTLREQLQQATLPSVRQELEDKIAELISEPERRQKSLETAKADHDRACEDWDNALRASHDWRNFRLSSEPKQDFFGTH